MIGIDGSFKNAAACPVYGIEHVFKGPQFVGVCVIGMGIHRVGIGSPPTWGSGDME